jgi:hypothetical protein
MRSVSVRNNNSIPKLSFHTTATQRSGSLSTLMPKMSHTSAVYDARYFLFGLIVFVGILMIEVSVVFTNTNLFETAMGSLTTTNGKTRHLQERPRPAAAAFYDVSDVRVLPVSTTDGLREPKIVWLMSFPNSGTSYTSQLVRDTTLSVSASNYADETASGQEGFLEPVYEDQIQGPFWIRSDDTPDYTEPTEYILTKVCSRFGSE